jgi:hypothetical protein
VSFDEVLADVQAEAEALFSWAHPLPPSKRMKQQGAQVGVTSRPSARMNLRL